MEGRPTKIISGGQTGVDRGALDAAIDLEIEHGGWSPPDRYAEDGKIPERYHVREVSTPDFIEHGYDYGDLKDHYRLRTFLNVKDADGTLILTPRPDRLTPGTRLTLSVVRGSGKPCLMLPLADEDAAWRIRTWVKDQQIAVLNVAGPRESKIPGIQARTCILLVKAFREPGG